MIKTADLARVSGFLSKIASDCSKPAKNNLSSKVFEDP